MSHQSRANDSGISSLAPSSVTSVDTAQTPADSKEAPNYYVREIKHENATMNDAYELATVFEWGFRNEIAMLKGRTGIYRFDGDVFAPINAIRDPRERLNAIVQRANCFRDRVEMSVWGWYDFLCDKRNRSFLAYDAEDDTPVFLALWSKPLQLVPKYTLWERIQRLYRRARGKVYCWWKILTCDKRVVGPSEVTYLVGEARKDFGLLSVNNEKEQEIVAKASAKSQVLYPLDLTYELVACCCSRPGRGFGYQAFRDSLAEVEEGLEPVTVNGTTVPPQALIMASREGERLYSKFGFKTIDSYERDVGEAKPFTLSLMQKLYY